MKAHLAALRALDDGTAAAEALRSEHAGALVVQLAEWAAANPSGLVDGRPSLQSLSELPWAPGEEEDALIGWIVHQV